MKETKETAVIQGKELSIGYHTSKGNRVVHTHLNFELRAGQLTCLLGANGAGKSTLLRTLAGAQASLAGEITLLGRPLPDYSERDRSRTIGIVLTDKTQAGGLTVYELVALGRQPHTGFFGRLHDGDHALIRRALDDVGITHKAQSFVAELSDGERQKTMIAKALVQECPLIILDEPTAFLDVVSRLDTMSLLHRLAMEQHKAILLSTHDVEQALVLADRLWLLSTDGGLTAGVTEDLILSHRMERLFPHSTISFDYGHGSFYPTVEGTREIRVSAADETLLHWAVNAMNRKGYRCLIGPTHHEAVAPTGNAAAGSSLPLLEVASATSLTLRHGDVKHIFPSFEEMLKDETFGGK